MESLINFLVESGISIAILTTIYLLFLRNETFFKANRIFLITSLLFAVILPFLQFNMYSFGSNSQAMSATTAANQGKLLQTVTIYGDELNSTAINILSNWQVFLYIYFIGVIIMFSIFLYKCFQVYILIKSGDQTKKTNYILVDNSETKSPFSFLNYIFYNKELYHKEEYHKKIKHEIAHIQQYHTLDIIILEILIIFQWFNPFIWILRKVFRENHEFLADKAVLETGISPADYKILLVNQAVGLNLQLTNNFNTSLIKKRIKMMTKMKSKKTALIKYLTGIAMLSLLIFVFACNQTDKEKESVDDNMIEEKINPIESAQVKTDKSYSTQELEEVNTEVDEENVFTKVDDPPKYKGGYSELQMYLEDNMKYPDEAQKKKIQGKVYVSFVVAKDGSIANVKVLRSVDPLLDKEAMRVVKNMPNWEPGKLKGEPVNVKFQLPVNFVMQ